MSKTPKRAADFETAIENAGYYYMHIKKNNEELWRGIS